MKAPTSLPSWARWDDDDLILQLRIQPRSNRDGFTDRLDDSIKLRIKAPPVDGKANAYLIALLSEYFGVAKQSVIIEKGHTSRSKRVRIVRPTHFPPEIRC